MSVEEKYKKKIIAVISALFPEAKIILFGSRARGTHGPHSDIDIAIDTGKKLRPVDVGEPRNMFAESNIPYRIEIVDFHSVPKEMQEDILNEGVVWKR